LDPVAKADIRRLETELKTPFPDGYLDFMARFGPGSFCDVLTVLSPAEVRKTRDAFTTYGVFNAASECWDNFDSLFPDGDPRHIISVATSIDGDEVVFFAGKPETLWTFPRQSATIERVGRTLFEALGWYQKAGVLITASMLAYFNSGVDQLHRVWQCSARGRDWMALRNDLAEIAGAAAVETHLPGDAVYSSADEFLITRRRKQSLLSTIPIQDDLFQLILHCDKRSRYQQVLQSALEERGWKMNRISG
jgi:hypothetical protein